MRTPQDKQPLINGVATVSICLAIFVFAIQAKAQLAGTGRIQGTASDATEAVFAATSNPSVAFGSTSHPNFGIPTASRSSGTFGRISGTDPHQHSSPPGSGEVQLPSVFDNRTCWPASEKRRAGATTTCPSWFFRESLARI